MNRSVASDFPLTPTLDARSTRALTTLWPNHSLVFPLLLWFSIWLALPSAGVAQTPPYGVRVLASSNSYTQLDEVAVDAQGDVFVGDTVGQQIYELVAVNGVVPANPTILTLGAGLNSLGTVAVDKSGNVYTSTYGGQSGSTVVEIVAVNGTIPANPTVVTLSTLPSNAQIREIALDGQGNLDLLIRQSGSDALLQLVDVSGSMPANPASRTLFAPSNADAIGYLAADEAGNAYYTYFDLSTTSLYKLSAVNGVIPDNPTPQALLDLDSVTVTDFTVDAKGNVFFVLAETDKAALGEVTAVNGTIPTNGTITTLYQAEKTSFSPWRLAVDDNDNIFSSTYYGGTPGQILEVSPSGMTLTPSTYDYGSINVSSIANETFTLTNTGVSSVNIASASLSNPSFTIASTTCTGSLAASASCTYEVEFAPTTPGAETATFTVTDDGGIQTASLTGTGVAVVPPPAPEAALTPASVDFGSVTVGSTSSSQTFTLANAGNAALAINSIGLAGSNASAFAISSNTCGTSLAAASSCTISVTFTASSAGSATAMLSVADNANGSPQTSSLTATGTAPPASADFTVAATPASQSVASGSSAIYSVNVASINSSFTQQVSLTASGLPTGATVTFSPAAVTPGGSGAQSTMTIQTAAQRASSSGGPPWLPFSAPVFAAVLLVLPFRSRKRIFRGLVCVLMLMGIAGALSACGGGFALPQTHTAPNAPPATYLVTVTGASGTLQHSTSVQITVR